MLKGGVNSFRREHGDKCSKSVKMEGGEDMHRKFCQVHAEGNVQVLEWSLRGVVMVFGSGDPMEEMNKFM